MTDQMDDTNRKSSNDQRADSTVDADPELKAQAEHAAAAKITQGKRDGRIPRTPKEIAAAELQHLLTRNAKCQERVQREPDGKDEHTGEYEVNEIENPRIATLKQQYLDAGGAKSEIKKLVAAAMQGL